MHGVYTMPHAVCVTQVPSSICCVLFVLRDRSLFMTGEGVPEENGILRQKISLPTQRADKKISGPLDIAP